MQEANNNINFIISCRTLISFQGHDYNYCKSVKDEALNKGWEVVILANKLLHKDIAKELGAIRFYSVDLGTRFKIPLLNHILPQKIFKVIYLGWNFILHNIFTYYDLRKINKYLSTSKCNIICFPTMSISNIYSIIKYLEKIPNHYDLKIAFINHFTSRPNIEIDSFPDKLHKFLYNKINHSKIYENIYLYSDTKELSEEFSIYTRKKIEVLPIPHGVDKIKDNELITKKDLIVGYLGDARTSKGFHLLPEIIELYNRNNPNSAIIFDIQSSIRARMQSEVPPAIIALEGINNVALYKSSLPPEDYSKLLNRIDIILLPYSRNHYHSQTSGIFSEARALGKSFIVPSKTWMAREIYNYGGGVIFDSHTPQSIELALNSAINNYSELSKESQARANSWNKYHNSSNYFDILSKSLLKS